MIERGERLFRWFILLPVLAILAAVAATYPAGGDMTSSKPELPMTVGAWARSDAPRLVTVDNIFDYMDGAGELYLGYRFDRLEVYEFLSPGKKSILVELYHMKTSDDAFGLLSLDWGGEPLNLGRSSGEPREIAPSWPRVLYGEGLLRLISGALYARILTEQETDESREAVLDLGRAILEGGTDVPPPQLLGELPQIIPPAWKHRRDRTSYFRSHLVLNSLFYLSQENMFNLGPDTEAVLALYEKEDAAGSRRFHVLLAGYPGIREAREALELFRRLYLPEQFSSPLETRRAFPVEDGWIGWRLEGCRAMVVFECPDRETVETVLEHIARPSI